MFARDSCLVVADNSFTEGVSELCEKGGSERCTEMNEEQDKDHNDRRNSPTVS